MRQDTRLALRRSRDQGPGRLDPVREIFKRLSVGSLILAATACTHRAAPGLVEASPDRTEYPRTVFLHLFEWKWTDVALECERYLGPGGYRAVQISPPNEHTEHRAEALPRQYPWWARYQPVSYRLESRSGNRAEFRDMVERCNAVGVAIYADAVINHMADLGTKGVDGTPFDRDARTYADYSPRDFHPPCTIAQEDWSGSDDLTVMAKRARTQRVCQLGALPDLDTSSERVRARIGSYLQDLLNLGVGGFRIDAAKQMWPGDLVDVLDRLEGEFYVFHEVIDSGGQPVSAAEYTAIGDVTEFRYSFQVGQIFSRGSLASLATLGEESGLIPSDNAVVFIDNHDNQRGHGMATEVTHRNGALYDLANVFMLAWPYGTPKVMSSYEWGGKDDSRGPPHDGMGKTSSVHNDDGSVNCFGLEWKCEHRRPAIAGMVGFRNAMHQAGAFEISNWWSDGDHKAAFARGNGAGALGFVVINRGDEVLSEEFTTGLPAGRYCNILDAQSGVESRDCADAAVTVDKNGRAIIEVAPMRALALQTSRQP